MRKAEVSDSQTRATVVYMQNNTSKVKQQFKTNC
jgi:hypothetical protein